MENVIKNLIKSMIGGPKFKLFSIDSPLKVCLNVSFYWKDKKKREPC